MGIQRPVVGHPSKINGEMRLALLNLGEATEHGIANRLWVPNKNRYELESILLVKLNTSCAF